MLQYVSPSNPTIMAVQLVVWTQLLIQRHGSLWLCVIHCNSKLGTSCCLLFRSGWAKAVVSSISLFRRSCPIRIGSLNFYQHHGCESWALCHMMHPWKALESFKVKPPDFRHFKPNHPICCSHMQATTVQSKTSHYHPIKPSRFWIIWCLQISYTWFHAESLKTKPSTILQPTNPQIPSNPCFFVVGTSLRRPVGGLFAPTVVSLSFGLCRGVGETRSGKVERDAVAHWDRLEPW